MRHKVLEVVSNAAVQVNATQLAELQAMAERDDVDAVRRTLFELVSQIRGERAGAAPTLRIVANG